MLDDTCLASTPRRKDRARAVAMAGREGCSPTTLGVRSRPFKQSLTPASDAESASVRQQLSRVFRDIESRGFGVDVTSQGRVAIGVSSWRTWSSAAALVRPSTVQKRRYDRVPRHP